MQVKSDDLAELKEAYEDMKNIYKASFDALIRENK